nr:hypothetical protein [Clostridia bacterium]
MNYTEMNAKHPVHVSILNRISETATERRLTSEEAKEYDDFLEMDDILVDPTNSRNPTIIFKSGDDYYSMSMREIITQILKQLDCKDYIVLIRYILKQRFRTEV